jgi:ubiquinone/menaquinone biosynthesis C-methylase UbiE
MTIEGLDKLYAYRFSSRERERKDAIWRVLCQRYFQKFVEDEDTVLDIACGYGEFIRHIRARRKLAVDLNTAVRDDLPDDVQFFPASAASMPGIPSGTVDLCFASNFFEHLEDKRAMDAVLGEARRVLKPGGRFVSMQPNIRYAADKYWDFYDHVLPLSHLSAAEAFSKSGFTVEVLVPRFVPFSTKSAYPTHPLFVEAYLRLPAIWRFFGGQFVLVARSPLSPKNA